jgi:heme/copper-type cytochrome/quinol oxidase subunit 4
MDQRDYKAMNQRDHRQSKKQSFIESLTNTAVGFTISLAATFVIFPLVGINSTSTKNVIITLFFTAISIARGYIIRRFFNNKK